MTEDDNYTYTTTVTVGVFSRWERDLDFYRAFLWHLDSYLPRKRI